MAGVAIVAGAAAVASAAAMAAATGSMAATYQATRGGVIAKGSTFALLQSAGAAGLSGATQCGIATAAATVGGCATAPAQKMTDRKQAKGTMALPMMDGPLGFILLGPSPSDEIAAEMVKARCWASRPGVVHYTSENDAEMDNTSLVPKAITSPQPSASSSEPSRRYLNRELAAQFEDLRSVSEVAAPPHDFVTHRKRARSTRPRDSHSRAPNFTAATDHTRRAETSSSATKSTQTRSTRTHPLGDSSDSESEDSSKASKPSNSTPGPSGHGKPSMQPEGSSTKEKFKKAGMVAGVAIVAGAAAVAAAPLALAAVGFTSSGVAAGSMAAAYQATLGGVIAKGSAFALLQSAGAAGLSGAAQVGIAAAGATVGGCVTAQAQKMRDQKQAKGS